eukprot:339387-Hanusia_phi.AAC.1
MTVYPIQIQHQAATNRHQACVTKQQTTRSDNRQASDTENKSIFKTTATEKDTVADAKTDTTLHGLTTHRRPVEDKLTKLLMQQFYNAFYTKLVVKLRENPPPIQ